MTSERNIYQEVLTLLTGPTDYWDRPDCDWPGRVPRRELTDEEVSLARQRANTAYVMGSKALHREDFARARTWLAIACDQRHPGAAFRLAVLALRQASAVPAAAVAERTVSGILTALCRAAEWGHADAHRLIDPFITRTESVSEGSGMLMRGSAEALATALPALNIDPRESYEPQDPEYYGELSAFCTKLHSTREPVAAPLPESWAWRPLPARAPAAGKASDHGFQSLATGAYDGLVRSAGALWVLLADDVASKRWAALGARCHAEERASTGVRRNALLMRELRRRCGLEALEPYPGAASARWQCRCERCGAESSPNMRAALRGQVCRHCAMPAIDREVEGEWATAVAALWANHTDRGAVGVRSRTRAGDLVVERLVRAERRAHSNPSALAERSEFSSTATQAVADVCLAAHDFLRHWVTSLLLTGQFTDSGWWDPNAFELSVVTRPKCVPSAAIDRLSRSPIPPAPSPGSSPVGVPWAELLHDSAPLSNTSPRAPWPTAHVVHDEETLYLFAAPHPPQDPSTPDPLVTPTAITSLPFRDHSPTAPPLNRESRPRFPSPASTPSLDSVKVYALCP